MPASRPSGAMIGTRCVARRSGDRHRRLTMTHFPSAFPCPAWPCCHDPGWPASLGPGASAANRSGFHDAGPTRRPLTRWFPRAPALGHARRLSRLPPLPISSGPGIAARRQIVDTNARPCPAAAPPRLRLSLAGKLTIIRDKPANSAFRSPIRARLSTKILTLPNAAPGDGETLSDQIFKKIQAAIVKGEMAPGSKISEPELARIHGVSRARARGAAPLEGQRLLVRAARRRAGGVAEPAGTVRAVRNP